MQNTGEGINNDLDDLLDDSMIVVEGDRFEGIDGVEGNSISDEDFDDLTQANYNMTGDAYWEGRTEVGNTGFGDSKFDDGASIDEVQREGGLAKRRALLQPWTDQAANAVTQMVVGEAIGGTIEGIGYLLDFEGMYNLAKGNEKEYTNWFSELGGSLKEATADATQIYEENPGEMNLFDSGYWFKNSVSIASTLSIMIPGMAGAKAARYAGKLLGKGLAQGANKIGKAVGKTFAKEAAENGIKLGVRGEWMADGLTQAFVSRHIENTMEAKGTLDTVMQARLQEGVINKNTGLPYTEEEARMEASGAAAENYQKGWAMILQDIPQYLAIGKVFNPITKQMEVAKKVGQKALLSPRLAKVNNVAGSFLSEAAEEGYQGYISSKAHLNADLAAGLITREDYNTQVSEILGSDESKTAMLFGGLGGSAFSALGPKVNDLMKSKSRKELEAGAAEYRAAKMAEKAAAYQAMNVRKQEAETRGDSAGRTIAQDNIMASMIIDGLENNNLEEVMEALASGADMSPEQIAALEEKIGGQFDPALAKEGATRALEMAEEIKASYFAKLQKKSNKDADRSLVASETLSEFQNKNFVEQQKNLNDANRKIVEDMKFDESTKPTDEWVADRQLQTKEASEKFYLEALMHMHDKAAKEDKSFFSDQIKIQKAKVKKTEKAVNESKSNALKTKAEAKLADKQAMKDMTPKEKEAFKKEKAEEKEAQDLLDKQNEGVYASKEGEIIDNSIASSVFGMRTNLNNKKITQVKSPEYRRQYKLDNMGLAIGSINNEKELDRFEKKITKELAGEYTSKEIADIQELVEKRRVEIAKEKAKAKKDAENAKIKEDLKKEAAKKNKDTAVPDSNVNNAVEDVVEDQHSPEEIDHSESIEAQQETKLESVTGSGKSFAPLDEGDVNNVAYNNWILNGESKVGQKVGYRKANRGEYRGNKKSNQFKAIQELEKAMALAASGQPLVISDFVYDNYPLEMFVADGTEDTQDKKLTGVASLNKKATKEQLEMYNNGTRPERIAIINALAKGEQPTSTIKHTGGGTIQNEVDVAGAPAVNSIKELEQFRDGQPIELVYSNEKGELMKMDKTRVHPDFPTTMLTAGPDADGNPIPYSGGIFVIMKKADGTTFPVKLNMARNSKEQAKLVAKLLVDITVPPGRKNENTGMYPDKKYTTKTLIKALEAEDIQAIEETFGPELALIGKDATLYDLLSMFTHISEKTEGMSTELFMSKNQLKFGGDGFIDPGNNTEESMQGLADFIEQVKPRPFSIKKWNDTANNKGYRSFIIDNRILNTDVTKEGPAFKSSEKGSDGSVERRVQIYIAPLAPKPDNNTEGIIDSNKDIKVQEPLVDDVAFEDDGRAVAETTGDPSMDIVENDGPTSVDINNAVIAKYPGRGFQMPLTKQKDGTYKTLLGATVTAKEFAELEKFKQDFVNEARMVAAEEKMAKRRAELDAQNKEAADNVASTTSEKVPELELIAAMNNAVEVYGATSLEDLKQYIEENSIEEITETTEKFLSGYADSDFKYLRSVGVKNTLEYLVNKKVPTRQKTSAITEPIIEKPSMKSIEMIEMQENNSDLTFVYFDGAWDILLGDDVIGMNLSKEDAENKAREYNSNNSTGFVKVNLGTQTYSVTDGVITNKNGKVVFAKDSSKRTTILERAAGREEAMKPIIEDEIDHTEWAEFLEGAEVSENRLRLLVAKKDSGKTLSLNEKIMLDSQYSKVQDAKESDVSQSNDTKISKQDEKFVSSRSARSGRRRGKGMRLGENKKNTESTLPTQPTKDDVQGPIDQGKEDTTC